MADQMDLHRAFQFLQGIYTPLCVGGVSTYRLGQIALELVTLRTAYENMLQSKDATRGEKARIRNLLAYLERVEKFVAQAYVAANLRSSISYGFPTVPLPISP